MERTYTLEEIEKLDSEAVDAETADTYSLEDLERMDSWTEGKNVLTTAATSFAKGFASDMARIPGEIGTLIKEQGEKGGAGLAIPSFNDGVSIARMLTGTTNKPTATDELFIKTGEMLTDKNRGFMDRLNLKPEEGSRLSQVAFDLGSGTSSVATSLGLLYATRSPSVLFGLFGARQKAQIYEESRAAGKTPEEASLLSSAAGLVEGGVEALGGVAFLKAVSFNKFVTRSLLRAGEQALEEGLQQTGEEAITKLSGVRKDQFRDSMLRIGYASALGFVLGVPAGVVTSSLEKTQVKNELKGFGLNDKQASKLMNKISEKMIADGSVRQEISNFLQEEMKTTEKLVNENPNYQPAAAPTAGDIYERNFQASQQGRSQGSESLYDTIASGLSKIAEPISTRLKSINPNLKNKLRRYEFDLKNRVLQDEKTVKPMLEAYQNLSAKDRADLDLALKNSDMEKVWEVAQRNNLTNEVQAVRETLDTLHKRAKETGLDIGFIENYFPRKVKDVQGMMKFFGKEDTWLEMQKALNQKEESLGRKLSDDEKIEMMNTMLKSGGARSAQPGNVKQRQISEVSPELNQYYQESPQALLNYIYRVNDFIEARRFFGKSVKGTEMSEKTLEDSIGAFVLDLLQSGDIKGVEAQEVSDILKARFGARGTSGLVSAVKNVTYLETMGNVTSAVTQIGDIAFSLYKSGFYRTGKALTEAIAGRSAVTKEDIGIERIAEEFADKTKSAEVLSAVFKMTGLNWMDRLGKQTTINAAFEKFSELAKKPTKAFRDEMQGIFGDETERTIADLKEKTVSDNVKYLLFSELADVQPIALSEMPEYYLKSGNGRIFYMLKTYTIKQIDVFRNEVFLQMKENPAKALGNFLRLGAALAVANATADMIKDVILGRPIELADYVIDNLLRLFGLTKFTLIKARKEGVTAAVTSFIVPPLGRFITSGTKDIDKVLKGEFEPKDAEIIQSVPLLGKFYYWWMGGGRSKLDKTSGGGIFQ